MANWLIRVVEITSFAVGHIPELPFTTLHFHNIRFGKGRRIINLARESIRTNGSRLIHRTPYPKTKIYLRDKKLHHALHLKSSFAGFVFQRIGYTRRKDVSAGVYNDVSTELTEILYP